MPKVDKPRGMAIKRGVAVTATKVVKKAAKKAAKKR